MSKYLTIEELAADGDLLPYDVSPDTLRYWRSKGIGPPSSKLGRRVVYRAEDVERWVQDQLATNARGGGSA